MAKRRAKVPPPQVTQPPQAATPEDRMAFGIDSQYAFGRYEDKNHYESANTSICGAIAVGMVVASNGQDEWADYVIEDLIGAQRELLVYASKRVDALQHQHWLDSSLLGRHGEGARQRALDLTSPKTQRPAPAQREHDHDSH